MAWSHAATDPWQLAHSRYMEDLNEEEKKRFATASLENLFYSASAAQKEHEEKSISRTISQRLEPFVAAIDQYGAALDIAKTFEKYFKKLIDMFTRIGDILPRCQVYHSLFPSHERLLQAISMAYLDIIHFCMDAKMTFRKLKRSTTVHFTLKSLWKDFNEEFEGTLNRFRNHVKNVEKEAGVSNLIESSSERALARADRAEKERQRRVAKRDQLLSQLSSLKYVNKHIKERKRRHPGTGSWLTETDEYKEWMAGDRSALLWCYGIPGSGKTVLASSLIDTLSADITGEDVTIRRFTSRDIIDKNISRHEIAIDYYYCDFSDSRSLETRIILGTIIRQLLENTIIPVNLEQKIDQFYGFGTRTATDDELASIFYAVIKLFSIIYICIDGLDECGKDEQAMILSVLNQLAQSDQTTVKIFVTSRQEPLISSSLRTFPHLQVSADKISLDITSFVKEKVKLNIRSGALTIKDSSLESDIISALVDGADGMFLWVYFQLADLCDATSDFGIRETLRKLPKGMAKTYARILRKIGGSQPNMHLAQRIFKWVVCAKRPLLITELGEAVAFGPTDRSWNSEKIPNASRLIQSCRSLVIFDEDDETVRLAHHTVRQFLLKLPTEDSIPEFHFQFSQANIEAGETCIAYLSFSDFEMQITIPRPNSAVSAGDVPSPAAILDSMSTPLGLTHIISDIFKLGQYMRTGNTKYQLPTFDLAKFAKLKKHPPVTLQEKYLFLNYAIENWISHTSDFSEDNTTMWKAFKYLAMEKPTIFDIRIWSDSRLSNDLPYTTLFRWAVGAGHVPLLKLLLQLPRGSNLHDYCRIESEKDRSIVLSALGSGHINVVEFLAKQACIDGRYGKQLIEAALNVNEAVVQLLLEYGLSLNGKIEALQMTARSEHMAAMRVLMQDEPLLDLQIERGKVALVEAAERDVDGVLMVLLDKAASFEAAVADLEEVWGDTALHGASKRGLDGVARLLLEKGADVDAKDDNRGTALHLAADKGHEAVARLLLEKGTDVNAKDNYGWTALHWAADKGQETVARLLLEKGADVNAKDKYGCTALHLAANKGHQTVARLLLGKGADINAKDGDRYTALHWAADKGHEAVARLLLEKRADINAKDSDGWTALHLAADKGHKAVSQLLLKKGADVNAKDNDGWVALRLAADKGHKAVAWLLLEKGADVNAKDSDGRTALHLAADKGHEAVARLLLEKGVDVNTKDRDGRTAMRWAADKGHKGLVRLLTPLTPNT